MLSGESKLDPGVLLQRQVRDNASDLHSFMADMRSWERDMKAREAQLENASASQKVPPVRSKQKKTKTKTKKLTKRIASSDYLAWEKFDADKACELVDDDEYDITLQDSEESKSFRKMGLIEEAQYEKERGNSFVHMKKWHEAIACYTRAIDLNTIDATFYANRALCYLKTENLHAAESDCTMALQLDPTYAKALLRRSSAREALGSLRRAASDLHELLKLEPKNDAIRRQLDALVQKMGTKGSKFKSSPASTPSTDAAGKGFEFNNGGLERDKNENVIKEESNVTNGNTTTETFDESDYMLVEPVNKPLHLISKKPLKRVPVYELDEDGFPIIIEKKCESAPNSENKSDIDCNNQPTESKSDADVRKSDGESDPPKTVTNTEEADVVMKSPSQESIISHKFALPKTSIQFQTDWRMMNDIDEKSAYLSTIPPQELPNIFKSSLESDLLSEILQVILDGPDFNKSDVGSIEYLRYLSEVKRFNALTMFLSSDDKTNIVKIFQRCVEMGETHLETIEEIQARYEL